MIDTLPPSTTDSLAGTQGTNGWFTGAVTVSLSAYGYNLMPGSAVAATYYQVDGGSYVPYSQPFLVSGDGSHTIHYYSINQAGNQGAGGERQLPDRHPAAQHDSTPVGPGATGADRVVHR